MQVKLEHVVEQCINCDTYTSYTEVDKLGLSKHGKYTMGN